MTIRRSSSPWSRTVPLIDDASSECLVIAKATEMNSYSNHECAICGQPATPLPRQSRTERIKCGRCGTFSITIEAIDKPNSLSTLERAKLSRLVYDQNRLGTHPRLTCADIAAISTMPSLTFKEKTDRLLLYVVERTRILGDYVAVHTQGAPSAILEVAEDKEVYFIAKYLEQRDWLEGLGDYVQWRATGPGFEKAEELSCLKIRSNMAFVAMSFNTEMDTAWRDGFRTGIEKAGYSPLRIDKTEHTNKICDEIISEIRRSRFVVSDFTGHRSGVYFEAGFALGLNLPVIWTCKKSDLGGLHFDVRQFNCIDWETPDELAGRLQVRISAVIGDGPLLP